MGKKTIAKNRAVASGSVDRAIVAGKLKSKGKKTNEVAIATKNANVQAMRKAKIEISWFILLGSFDFYDLGFKL